MKRYQRAFVIVIDSLGAGAMPDAGKFGDEGADTLGHIAETAGPAAPDPPTAGACPPALFTTSSRPRSYAR